MHKWPLTNPLTDKVERMTIEEHAQLKETQRSGVMVARQFVALKV